MNLARSDGGPALPLAGTWDYKVERALPPAVVDYSTRPGGLSADDPNSPTVLWNAMMAPLTPFPLAGAIWYQGEANADRAYQYRTLFPTMIAAWREAWGLPDLPFLFVQLANFMAPPERPGESAWAELREAQTMTLQLPHTGMAVILDIGEADDIHPRDKKDVGLRLALQALKGVYGMDVVASGPTFASAAREGAAMRVRFRDTNGGLVSVDGGAPRGFALAHRWRLGDRVERGDPGACRGALRLGGQSSEHSQEQGRAPGGALSNRRLARRHGVTLAACRRFPSSARRCPSAATRSRAPWGAWDSGSSGFTSRGRGRTCREWS
jgi:hypothetical protein